MTEDIELEDGGVRDKKDGRPGDAVSSLSPSKGVLDPVPTLVDDSTLIDASQGAGPPPDGGWKAYWVCVGAFLCNLSVFGFSTAFGQLKVYYLNHQLSESTESEVGWIASISFFLIYSNSMFAGRFFDAHGARGLMIAGAILQIVGMICIAFCKTYWQFFLAHTAVGLAGSITYAPSMAVISHWFGKKRSTMVGVVSASSSLGGMIYTIMFKNLLAVMSFRNGMLIVAGMTGFFLFITCLTIQSRHPPKKPAPWHTLRSPWKERPYFFLALGTAIVLLNWASPYFNAPVYALSNHTSPAVHDYSVVYMHVGSLIGRASVGYIATRLGAWKVFSTYGILSSVVLFGLWIPSGLSDAPVVLGLLLFGLTSGAWMPLVTACCADISPVHENGSRLGMIWTLCALPSLAGPVICGALIDRQNGSFELAAVFSGVTILLGVVITIAPILMWRIAECAMARRGREASATAEERIQVAR